MIKYLITASLFIFMISSKVMGQDDLLRQLEFDSMPHDNKVMDTFKGTKIINAQTNETLKKRSLNFRVSHLFGNIGSESGGGSHTLYGFDQSADIRINLDYGISDRWTVGVSRCKRNENLEGLTKFRILEQSPISTPLSITFFGNTTYTTKARSAFLEYKPVYRFNYTAQVIIARKFSSKFSFELIPSFVHRNIVTDPNDKNNLFSIGGGLRWKFTRSTSVITDYFYTPPIPEYTQLRYNTFGAGIEIETGGHIFSIMFTNASGILENDFIPNTIDSWAKGGFKFSFIISRMFQV